VGVGISKLPAHLVVFKMLYSQAPEKGTLDQRIPISEGGLVRLPVLVLYTRLPLSEESRYSTVFLVDGPRSLIRYLTVYQSECQKYMETADQISKRKHYIPHPNFLYNKVHRGKSTPLRWLRRGGRVL
jgi:hypothetical protein